MIKQHVAPSALAAGLSGDDVLKGADKILGALQDIHKAGDLSKGAALARTLRLETMVEVRKLCDDLESKVPLTSGHSPRTRSCSSWTRMRTNSSPRADVAP